ncbi:MAG: sigma 54-interacting transcriptional regulator [Rhodothermales bacterium]
MSAAEPQNRSNLEALFDIALTLNSIQESGALMEKVLEAAMDALGADRGFVLLNSETERAGFEVRASMNFTEEQLGDVVRISTSVVHRVLQTGEPVMVHEALEDERFSGAESIVVQRIKSIACVPLRLKSRQIGAIYMDCLTDRSRFKQDNLPFLEAFSNLAAVAIENARLYQTLRDENRQLRSELQRIHGFDEMIGQSPPMRRLYAIMERVLDNDATVLIEGESGTGKELVARAIHYNGHRQKKPFLALFCGSLPDTLLESELFGYKKGAFTGAAVDKAGLFEAADGGTLFLDEVGDLSPSLQTALLRVLQEGEIKRIGETKVRHVDVRILSATNKPLKQLIKDGSFREDLLYRLNTISLTTPPLRDRGMDIPLLANFFLDKYAVGRREYIKGFTPEAIEAMRAHPWPGNVRELQNTIERAVVMARGEFLDVEDMNLPAGEKPLKRTYHEMLNEGQTLADIEKRVVLEAMKDSDGNVSETARRLGVSRGWIHNRLKEWNLPTS